ncbi:MAG: hypothetical protein E4H42_00850 [Chromatiales bacterium]|jgi:hypothetical protein|nr:MAG: hypothetical protein E4H42_00850 [Chromatiales bacterium]
MLSSSYSASLTPDPWLRIFVLTSGRLLIAGGLVLILTLDISAQLRVAASLVWLAYGRFEMRRVERGFLSCAAIRIHSGGEFELQNVDQEWVSATLLSGSVVLQKIAWLRLRTANGTQCAELLRGDARKSHDWRHFQVIWRHIGARR